MKFILHIQDKKCFRIKHTIKNPNFFVIDNIFIDYITNHDKKFNLYLVKCDFKLNSNNFNPHIKTEFYHNTTIINLKNNYHIRLNILF